MNSLLEESIKSWSDNLMMRKKRSNQPKKLKEIWQKEIKIMQENYNR